MKRSYDRKNNYSKGWIKRRKQRHHEERHVESTSENSRFVEDHYISHLKLTSENSRFVEDRYLSHLKLTGLLDVVMFDFLTSDGV